MAQNELSSYRPEEVSEYFDRFGDREWERMVETPAAEVSLYIHTHYLNEYLRPGSKVLEIGAGAGRFTQVLAGLNARVTVGDISQVQLDLNRQNAQRYGFADAVEGWEQVDICDMGVFQTESFDSVVAYGGPLSYVLDHREVALMECLRVLKPNGLLFLSVMSLWGTVHSHLKGVLETPLEINRKITETGDISPETFPGRGNYMHLFRAEDLRSWLESHQLKIVQISASHGLSARWHEYLKEIRSDDEKWDELLRMELENCAEPGSWNMGTHILAVARKM